MLLLVAACGGAFADDHELCRTAMRILTGWDRSVAHRSQGRALALGYLESKARELGAQIEIQQWEEPTRDGKTVTLRNLIATIPGTDPTLADEIVVVGAHYDAQNNRSKAWEGRRSLFYEATPGADDNASGVVALLALMQRLRAKPPRRTVKFVFFDGEEPGQLIEGLRGSEHFVGSLGDMKGRIKSALIFDMIGAKPRAANGAYHLSLYKFPKEPVTRFLAAHPTAGDLNFFARLPREPEFHGLYTDSAPFMRAGIPTMMFSNTATLENLPLHYHSERDTPDVIDWESYPRLLDQFERLLGKLSSPERATREPAQ